MVRDLFVVRLLEDRRVVREHYLCGGQRSKRLSGEEAFDHLSRFNEWAGWELFDLRWWRWPGPGDELARLDYELHLSRFWPPGMPVEVLGSLWEERLPAARRTGVYYTPPRIVDLVLSFALSELLGRERTEPLTILDPACGVGYFLVETYRRLAEQELIRHRRRSELFAEVETGESGRMVLSSSRRMELIREHIFGVDIDAQAVELARRLFYTEILADLPAFLSPAPDPAPLFTNFREGDSILSESFPLQAELFDPTPLSPGKPFRWEDRKEGFGNVVLEGGFSCIIGNPPWVSLKGRHRQTPYAPAAVEHLVIRYNADTYRPNLVEFFIRRAVELLQIGGYHSFVVPDRIAENEQFAGLRQFMAAQGEILRLHFREPFPGVAADTLVYLFHKRSRPRKSAKIEVTDATGRRQELSQNYWSKGRGFVPEETPPDETEEILRRMEAMGKRPLSDFLETGVGFIARPGRVTAEQISSSQRRAIKGEHISPYHRRGEAWLEFALHNLAGGTRSLEKLVHPHRILLRKTGARLIAARDQSRDLPEQSLYFAFLHQRRLLKNYDLRYFLGILNSRIMSFYFRHRKITNRATTPQIKKVHLDSLPIRPINFNDPLAAAAHHALVNTVSERENAADPERKKQLDDQIDQITAELYGLQDRHLKIVREEMKKGWE